MDDATAARLSAFWEAHCKPQAWNFITTGLHHGDFLHMLSVLNAFRRIRAGGLPVRMLAVSKAHYELASTFADRIDELILTPGADFTGLEISEWRVATRRDAFAPGELISMLPHHYFRRPLRFEPLWYVLNDHGLFYIHLIKLLLNLPLDIAPHLPAPTPEARAKARALFDQHGLSEGRSLVLFPFQHSHPQGFDYTQDHFAALAARAAAAGLSVCTSVAPGEAPMPGTPGIFIPFSILVPFCDLAGHAVTWRSGISDILAPATCAKVHLYTSQEAADHHGPIAFALGGVERNLGFDFVAQPDPARFADAVMSVLLAPAPTDGSACVPRRVRDQMELRLRPDRPNGLFRTEDYVIRSDWGRIFTSGVLGEGWSGVEPWGIWSQGYRSILYLRPAIPHSLDPAEAEGRSVELVLDLQFALVADIHEELRFSIEVNGEVTPFTGRWPERGRRVRMKLRPELLRGPLRVTFVIDNPETPRVMSKGENRDERLIGIGLGGARYELADMGPAQRRRHCQVPLLIA